MPSSETQRQPHIRETLVEQHEPALQGERNTGVASPKTSDAKLRLSSDSFVVDNPEAGIASNRSSESFPPDLPANFVSDVGGWADGANSAHPQNQFNPESDDYSAYRSNMYRNIEQMTLPLAANPHFDYSYSQFPQAAPLASHNMESWSASSESERPNSAPPMFEKYRDELNEHEMRPALVGAISQPALAPASPAPRAATSRSHRSVAPQRSAKKRQAHSLRHECRRIGSDYGNTPAKRSRYE